MIETPKNGKDLFNTCPDISDIDLANGGDTEPCVNGRGKEAGERCSYSERSLMELLPESMSESRKHYQKRAQESLQERYWFSRSHPSYTFS